MQRFLFVRLAPCIKALVPVTRHPVHQGKKKSVDQEILALITRLHEIHAALLDGTPDSGTQNPWGREAPGVFLFSLTLRR